MKNFYENLIYFLIKNFGAFVRILPDNVALVLGRLLGLIVYYFDIKHKSLAYGNLKIAFAKTKTPNGIKRINKRLFVNFGQNLIELFRLPLMDKSKFRKYVKIEGGENIVEGLKKKKGLILLAMHFGSWELASLSCAMFEHPYKVIVKPQKKFLKLDELLNSYRSCGGNVVLSRGLGTRELIKSLHNNEVIGMVVDQGGRDGCLVPFFDRQASMSVGAIRMALKFGIPVCFSIIIREKGMQHRMIVHKPFDLIDTGDMEHDIVSNLRQVATVMEHYIEKYPSEYMWFYKIWKYSKQSTIMILSDGRTGHLRQSQTVSRMLKETLQERKIECRLKTVEVKYKNKYAARMMSVLSFLVNSFITQGRLESMKWVLTKESFDELMSIKADFILSCGSSIAGINWLLSKDQSAKSVVILKPGLLSFDRFNLVILPEHDRSPRAEHSKAEVAFTVGAPNLIDKGYLKEQSEILLNRYSHLKFSQRLKIGLLLGGDSKNYYLGEKEVKVVINQIKEVSAQINADIFVTTSRRTSTRIENLLIRELKQFSNCKLFILANRENIPEAVGGMLGLCDILVVSGDSISMVSEAASSGKDTIVFAAQEKRKISKKRNKHKRFINKLNSQGYIISSRIGNIRNTIYNIAKNKIQTRKIDDRKAIFDAVKNII